MATVSGEHDQAGGDAREAMRTLVIPKDSMAPDDVIVATRWRIMATNEEVFVS
jgi:hypothetical protein